MGLASTTKYLRQIAGQLAETFAITTSAGGADANAIPALNASGVLDPTILNATVTSSANKIVQLDGNGRLDTTVMPVGLGADTAIIVAWEILAAGDYVNVFDAGAGVFKVRKADATTAGKHAMGFVLAAVPVVGAGQTATVYFEGTNTSVTGQTPGDVFLQIVAGKGASTIPSATGNVVQNIGFAVSATAVNFQSNRPVTLA